MRVLHVIESLGVGGAERLLVVLLPELVRQECQVKVAVRGGAMDLAPTLEKLNIPVVVMPSHHKWNLLAGARNVALVAKDMQADVIHAHLYFPAVYTAFSHLLKLTKSASCVSFHNLAYAGANKASLALRVRKSIARFLYPKGMTAIIAVSKAVAHHYEDALHLNGILVVHNPIDLIAIDLLNLKSTKSSSEKVCLVLPGRLVREKGHVDFLKAVTLLKNREINISVILAGDGPQRKAIEHVIVEKELTDCVAITGMLAHSELMRVMSEADVVVVPSRYEGFGLTALEAMALAKPVVATKVGGLPEVIGNAGMLVPAANPEILADVLEKLIKNPDLREELATSGRHRAEVNFSLPILATKLIDIYRKITSVNDKAIQ